MLRITGPVLMIPGIVMTVFLYSTENESDRENEKFNELNRRGIQKTAVVKTLKIVKDTTKTYVKLRAVVSERIDMLKDKKHVDEQREFLSVLYKIAIALTVGGLLITTFYFKKK